MNFEKKLKSRLNIAIAYIITGIVIIILCMTKIIENEYLMSFGVVLTVMGLLRILQYKRITRNEESIRSQEIAEKDERSIAIMHKSKSMAFGLYVLIACMLVIIFQIIGITEYSNILALSVCSLVLLYWISYFIYNKKS